jgi:hypothetical protein
MTRHPKLGAVERRLALLVNFLTSRELRKPPATPPTKNTLLVNAFLDCQTLPLIFEHRRFKMPPNLSAVPSMSTAYTVPHDISYAPRPVHACAQSQCSAGPIRCFGSTNIAVPVTSHFTHSRRFKRKAPLDCRAFSPGNVCFPGALLETFKSWTPRPGPRNCLVQKC